MGEDPVAFFHLAESLGRNASAAFEATAGKDLASVVRGHPSAEAGNVPVLNLGRLIRFLHADYLRKFACSAIIPSRITRNNKNRAYTRR